ncbi:hypothetical protein APB26_32520 [Pseudomonas aeruginosa]|uniref:hypothetical protein n=1 Tax=Pseudomonas aeruginosa TaxID=287 RepID=UPI00071BA6DD|nr:hypothetical protein [Pseudomonas aeruginosa]KSQ21707.1 hypothetical protein APB26_32520 [Pseudomonas aeruginosa]RPV61379.1 hypothetical protein IPC838_18855 [Pseudomonas aeruginosa]
MVALAGYVLMVSITIFWGGAVAAILWGWFVVPLGVDAVSYWQAVGLGCLSALLLQRQLPGNDKTSLQEDVLSGLAESALKPGFVLLVGWVAHYQLSGRLAIPHF